MRRSWLVIALTVAVLLAWLPSPGHASLEVRASQAVQIGFVKGWGNESTPPEVIPPAAQTSMNLTLDSNYAPGRQVVAMGTACINGTVAPTIRFSDSGGSVFTNLANDTKIGPLACAIQLASVSALVPSAKAIMTWTVPPLRAPFYVNMIFHAYSNVQAVGVTNHSHGNPASQLIVYNPPSFNGSWLFGMATDMSSCPAPGGNSPTFFTQPTIAASTVRIKENHALLQLCAQSGDTNSSVAQGVKQALGWSVWSNGDSIAAVTGELIPTYFPPSTPYNPPASNPSTIVSAGLANIVFILGAMGMVGFVFLLAFDFFRKVWE
jgi:hypothetical protein